MCLSCCEYAFPVPSPWLAYLSFALAPIGLSPERDGTRMFAILFLIALVDYLLPYGTGFICHQSASVEGLSHRLLCPKATVRMHRTAQRRVVQ